MSVNDDKKPVRQRKATQKKSSSRNTAVSNETGESTPKPKPKRKYVTRKTSASRKTGQPKVARATAAPLPATAAEPVASPSVPTSADLSRQRIKAALSGSARPTPAEAGNNGSPQAGAQPEAARRVSSEERRRMIAERAYELAMARGFRNGHPVDDWLAAEAEIDAAILSSHEI